MTKYSVGTHYRFLRWSRLKAPPSSSKCSTRPPTSIETDEAVVGMAEFESYEEAVLPGVAVVLLVDESPGEADAAVPSYGRLDQVVSIEPPTQTERLEILRIMTKTWQVDERFLSQLSESTGGFVGADLLSLCQKALQVCMNEAAATKMQGNAVVCPHHFEQALAVTYPSVLQTHNVSQKQQQLTSTSIQKHGGIN
ncbi:hypothetical protein PC128_g23358 [Phytophthora cactorum]|nr:hypothetical protein PC128_g23358 [Phytophthora cactorum]